MLEARFWMKLYSCDVNFVWLLRTLDAILVVLMGLRVTYGFSETTHHRRTNLACAVLSCNSTDGATAVNFLHTYLVCLQCPLQAVMHLVVNRYQRAIQYVNFHATMLNDMYRW